MPVDIKSSTGKVRGMSLAEIKEHVDRLTPAEKTELRLYLDKRIIRERERKLAQASEAMTRMDAGGGVPLEKIWSVMEEQDRTGR